MTFDPTQPPLIFGEVLFDLFPAADGTTTRVLGGAPFNVAWHLHAFGQQPLLISRVGEDALGDALLAAMRDHAMATHAMQRDPSHPTGTVQVTLDQGEPSYEIVAERAYDFIDAAEMPPCPSGALLYHGSLALRHAASRQAFEHLRQHSAPARFVDVNLRDPWWTLDALNAQLAGARWLKLNAAELALLAPSGTTPEQQAQALLAAHHLHTIFVTQGAAGAFALSKDSAPVRVAPTERVSVVDAVGAGDGFAAVLILGLLRHWPLEQTLSRAQQFAAAIVGQRGATVQNPEFYSNFMSSWG